MAEINLNGVRISEDGEVFIPELLTVGAGAKTRLTGDGGAEHAEGICGFNAEGGLRIGTAAQPITGTPPATHYIEVTDRNGNLFKLLAIEVVE